MSLELITGRDVAFLDTQQFPIVMNALLAAEAGQHKIPLLDLTVTSQTNDPDGGIDAQFLWPAQITHEVLASGNNVLQFKTGKISKEILSKEFCKPDVQAALKAGGTYIMCVGYDYTGKWIKHYNDQLVALCKKKRVATKRAKLIFGGWIARWISRYPSVAALPELRRGIPEFISVTRWKEDNANLANEFRPDASRAEIIENISHFLDSASPNSVVRIEGPAGVGKTRLALEAVLVPQFAPRTLYVQNADHPDVGKMLQAFYASPEIHAIVVIDECDASRQSALQAFAQNSNGRIKLICVGIAEVLHNSPQPTLAPLYQLKPLDAADITAILQTTFPNAPSPFVELSTRLSSGYVKLAIFIVQLLVENGIQPAVVLAKDFTIQTFLKKFVPQGMLLSLQALSILARIGWEEDLREEAETVAKFVGLPFQQLQRETNNLRNRGVVVPRGRYLYVSPDLLAVNAAADLWDTMGSELIKLVEEFPVQEPRRQLLRRVAMMGEHSEVKKAVEKILSKSGLFPDLPNLDDPLLSEIFRILSSAVPEAATNLLVETICTALRPDLLDFKRGRRDVVWAIESLLRWPTTSLDAARSLMMLALSETETIANNATGVLETYFHVFLSGSPIPLADRFALIDELLAMGDSDARLLAAKTVGGAVETHESRMGGETDPFSGKPYPAEWKPTNNEQLFAARRLAIRYLENIGQGEDTAAALARRTRLRSTSLLPADDAVALLEASTPLNDEERRIIVEACIRVEERPQLPDNVKVRLLKVRQGAFGASFFDQLRRWVGKRLHTDYDLANETGFASADEQLKQLAAEAAENGLTDEELAWLASSEAENVWLFGHRFGELDRSGRWEERIKTATEDDFNCLLFTGYLAGRYPAGMDVHRSAAIDQIEPSKPMAAFGATWRLDPNESGAQRVIRLVRSGRIVPSALRVFMYGTWLPNLPIKYTIEILDLVLGEGPSSNVEIALGIIDNFLRSKAASINQFGESAWRTIEAIPASRVSNTFDWHWGRVAEPLASADPKRFARAFVGLFASDETWLATDSAQHCLRVATTIDPEAVWSVVGPALLKADKAGMRLRIKLEHWFGELIPPAILLKWAKQKGRKGFLLAAQLMTLKSGAPSEAARMLVREATNPDEVLLLIFSSLHFGFGAGPLSGLLERSLEPLRILAKDPEPRIRAWAKARIVAEEKTIKRQKLLEEELDF